MSKKVKWTKPQLIVLTRGTPEEAVLTHCKRIDNSGPIVPQTVDQIGCDQGDVLSSDGKCGACQSRSGS